MKFRTEFAIPKMPFPITHQHRLLLIGSCFTENIGEKLRQHKFSVLENPNGILFNPTSVCEALHNYCTNKSIDQNALFHYNEAWHSWQHHSRFSGLQALETIEKINTSTRNAHQYLGQADVLFITLGSAWVYELTNQAINHTLQKVAANNHKAPANWFTKRLLNAAEVIEQFKSTLAQIWQFNPQLKVVFTISPVRHLREGAVENNRSKAVLIQSVHALAELYPEQIYYFPAYELVIDDLRDYRFYAEDLVHPNYYATTYVWEKLIDACIDSQTAILMQAIADIRTAANHKAFNPHSQQHAIFVLKYLEKIKALQAKHPYLPFENEISLLTNNQN